MWNRLVRLWHALTDWTHPRRGNPQNIYRRSNLHGRR
jgi:hypothetical protein